MAVAGLNPHAGEAGGLGREEIEIIAPAIAGLQSAGNQGLTDPDGAPEPPTEPVSITGDVWLLGRHRLLCGDSTVAADVAKVLAGVKPHLLATLTIRTTLPL